MRKPTRRERQQLRRLQRPAFTVDVDSTEIVRQLESHLPVGRGR